MLNKAKPLKEQLIQKLMFRHILMPFHNPRGVSPPLHGTQKENFESIIIKLFYIQHYCSTIKQSKISHFVFIFRLIIP